MLRVPVLSLKGTPLMPTKPSRTRPWIEEKKAVGKFNNLGQFYVQLLVEPSDTKTQYIALGIDPGKLFSGKRSIFSLAGVLAIPLNKSQQISVSDFNWKRLGQFTASKVVLLQRSTGLICKQETDFVGATIC